MDFKLPDIQTKDCKLVILTCLLSFRSVLGLKFPHSLLYIKFKIFVFLNIFVN